MIAAGYMAKTISKTPDWLNGSGCLGYLFIEQLHVAGILQVHSTLEAQRLVALQFSKHYPGARRGRTS